MKGGIAERFWSKVSGGDVGNCWEWMASTSGGGYGTFCLRPGRKMPAHRWAYEELRAEIPPGLFLDHLCRNRRCVNPWHLEPVTPLVNSRRGATANRQTCPQGHPYSPENTYTSPTRGDRQCRTCIRRRNYQAWLKVQDAARRHGVGVQLAREIVKHEYLG